MTPTQPIRVTGAHAVLASLTTLALALAACSASPSASSIGAVPSASPSTSTATPTATPTAASPTGQMTVGRQIHTATLLADGRVLVAGGVDRYDVALASAELHDPQTGTFSPTGSLATARGFHTATRLADGRVLFAGGNPRQWNFPGPFFTSAELYDPQAGTFSPTGSLATGRNLHTATLLLDGRVLITGGNDRFRHAVASAEVYDPTTGTFSPAGSMATARGFHTATLLADGRVLIAGGGSAGWTPGQFAASAEIYDPKTDTFTATGPMTDARALHTATLLDDGRVLITGGFNNYDTGGTSLASAELYDPKTGTFTATGSMADARTFHGAALLSDGRVLVTGGVHTGWDYYPPFLTSAEIYDPTTGAFTATGPMADGRVYHTATLVSDGRVLIAGGFDGSGVVATAELYDPQTGTFSPNR
ncbi:MAG: hypothetical protein OEW24_07625 [Chloroflexota bacterium]|nr:hypothetical protein [Chloroflexota bacterium]